MELCKKIDFYVDVGSLLCFLPDLEIGPGGFIWEASESEEQLAALFARAW